MLVKTSPQAQSHWFRVDIPQSEIQELLNEEWDLKSKRKFRNVTNNGKPLSQGEAEQKLGLKAVYSNLWKKLVWEGIQKQDTRSVFYLEEFSVHKEGDSYVVNGVFFWEPAVSCLRDTAIVLDKLNAVKIRHPMLLPSKFVDEEIARLRAGLSYTKDFMEERIDLDPLVVGDTCIIKMWSDMSKSLGAPKSEKSIIVLSDRCPKIYFDSLIGKKVGDDAIMSDVIDFEGSTKHITLKIKILSKVIARAPSDEELCKAFNKSNLEDLRETVRITASKKDESEFPEKIERLILSYINMDPIPGVMVWDRAEGMYEYAFSKSGKTEEQFLNDLGKTRDEAVQQAMPIARKDIARELGCKFYADLLTIKNNNPEILAHATSNGMDAEDPQVCYYANINLLAKKVLKYYEDRAREKPSIILPGQSVVQVSKNL